MLRILHAVSNGRSLFTVASKCHVSILQIVLKVNGLLFSSETTLKKLIEYEIVFR